MKCINCINEAEKGYSICSACDRDEWRDATKEANKRFKLAERKLSKGREQNAELLEALKSAHNLLELIDEKGDCVLDWQIGLETAGDISEAIDKAEGK